MSPYRLIPLLAAALPLAAPAQIVINEIAAATSDRIVRYDETGAPHLGHDPQWHHPSFDDSAWATGESPLATSSARTLVNRETTALYARLSFEASPQQAASQSPLTLTVNYDDGFIAYINGVEVARSNLGPEQALAYHDQTAYNANNQSSVTLTLPPASTYLVAGENTLAIQVHTSQKTANVIKRLDATLSLQGQAPPLVPPGSVWSHFDGGVEPTVNLYDRPIGEQDSLPPEATNWKLPDFDDSRWPDGPTPIGYDVDGHYNIATDVGSHMQNSATSLYIRASFDLTENQLASITSLELRVDFDDAFVASLNGREFNRSNVGRFRDDTPYTAIANSSHGARFDDGGNRPTAIVSSFPSTGELRPGKNTLSIQLHNSAISDPDLFLSVVFTANGLAAPLVTDGHAVSYFIGTSEPTPFPGSEPEDPDASPKITDWIELHNPTDQPVDLTGWSLTDDPDDLQRWTFPAMSIAPGAHLIVRASNRNRATNPEDLHTNFRLSASGEFLALVRPDGSLADRFSPAYPQQSYFHTYGRTPAGELGYFSSATPGGQNPTSNLASFLSSPEADKETGIYADHVRVTLVSPDENTTVRYTTDGTDPTPSNGFVYDGTPVTTGLTSVIQGTPGNALREIWIGVPGTSIDNIPTGTPPDQQFNATNLAPPPDWADNYAERFRGFLLPETTGDYTIWLSASDVGDFRLSTDNSPSNLRSVASVPSPVAFRQWDAFPSQQSQPVRLEAGRSYYFESLRKAGVGFDHVTIAWQPPGKSRTTISGASMAPVFIPPTSADAITLTLKARAFSPGHVPSPVTTHTYLVNQTADLLNTHSLLISGDSERSLFNPNGATAIVGGTFGGTWAPNNPTTDYNMAMEEGRPFERPIVFEYVAPGGSLGFRNEAAVRIAGSPHARPRYNFTDLQNSPWLGSWTQKPSLNFFFRDELGNASVNYPLFGENRVSTFSDFRLRAGKNDSSNPFIKDEVMRRLSEATGQPASRGIFVNLFINGHYKAYFNLTERLRERFFQEHHNSSKGWDIWHIREIVEGERTHYDDTMELLRAGSFTNAARYDAAASRIDLTSYIDYIIVNAYGATGDWPHNNYNLARERSPSGKWHFNIWDAEGAFGGFGHDINWNTLQQDLVNGSGNHMTSLVYRALRTNPEFRLLFADRIQKHFFDDGGLTQDSILKIYQETRDEFAPVLRIGRSQSVNESFFNNWWPARRNILFSHFRSQQVWPDTRPPTLNHPPGEVATDTQITMENPNATGAIYYTTDATDPRSSGGTIAGQTYDGTPLTITKSTLVRTRVRQSNGEWSPVRDVLFTTPDPPKLVISEIYYNPEGDDSLEFIELKNTGTADIDLSGITFSNGIDFTFSTGVVTPGDLIVLVKDPTAFAAAYPGVSFAGVFTGSLNNGGERITISEPGGRTVFSVRYNDRDPWPTSADGAGFSIVLSDESTPDSPTSWHAGAFTGGTPGSEPATTFATWQASFFSPGQLSDPLDDPDGDLIPNIIEYALALSPLAPNPSPLTPAAKGVTYTTYAPASDVTVTLLSSPDLVTWLPVGTGEVTPNGDGTQTHNVTTQHAGSLHFRLSVTLNP